MDIEIKKKNGWMTIMTYLIIFYVVATIIQLVMINITHSLGYNLNDPKITNFLGSLMNFVTYTVLIVALLFINFNDLKSEYMRFKLGEKDKTLTILGAFGIFYIISLVFQNLVMACEENINMGYRLFGINNFINTTSNNQSDIEQVMQGSGAIFMFVSAVFIGPICEEIVFRKAFFDIFKTPEIAILISSIFFGGIHVISSIGSYSILELFLMTVPYVASGVALGYVYIRSKQNIWIPIFVHILSNLISMVGIMMM